MSAVPSVWMNTLWFRYFACGVRLAPCAAADTDHDGPENVDRIPGILDRRAEADDRQRADHTERQSDVVPDDDHDRCGDERQHRERYVKLHAVYAAAVRKTVGQENKARDHCSDRHAEHDGLSCQLAAACL